MGKINSSLYTSNTDLWGTPQKVFDELNAEFHFTLDPCAIPDNAKCSRYFTPDEDGLTQDWGGAYSILQSSVFANGKVGGEMCT